mgnify:CR=1 FL=1
MPNFVSKPEYERMMKILAEGHAWKLSPNSLDAFYERIEGATVEEFDSAFSSAQCIITDYRYTPAHFVGALKQAIRNRAQNPVRRLPAKEFEPSVDGLARCRRMIASIRAGNPYPTDRAEFRNIWSQPVSDEDLLAVEGKSLADVLNTAPMSSAPSDDSEEEWIDAA